MTDFFDDGYRYHSNMQARTNWRLLSIRQAFAPLREKLFAKWNKPNRRGFRAVSRLKEDARNHLLWRRG